MFDPFLNYSASTYEAIIAAFILLGLLQSVALRRKANQVRKMKKDFVAVIKAATGAILSTIATSGVAVAKARRERDEAIKVADEATAFAERAARDAMEARADADDAEDELRESVSPTGRLNRAQPDLASLLDLIGGGGRRPSGSELLESILSGGPRHLRARTTFPGFDASGGTFNREPGAPDVPFSFADLKAAIAGDASVLERKVGAVPGSTILEVVGADGRRIEDAEREAVLASFLHDGAEASTVGIVSAGLPVGLLAALEQDAANAEAAKDFGPDSGAANPDVGSGSAWEGPAAAGTDGAHDPAAVHPAEAEACATQRAPERSVPRYDDDDTKIGKEREGFHCGARSGQLGFDG